MGTPSGTPEEVLELLARVGIPGIELIMQDDYKTAVPTMVTAEGLAGDPPASDQSGGGDRLPDAVYHRAQQPG